jgi:hypothetical protein
VLVMVQGYEVWVGGGGETGSLGDWEPGRSVWLWLGGSAEKPDWPSA